MSTGLSVTRLPSKFVYFRFALPADGSVEERAALLLRRFRRGVALLLEHLLAAGRGLDDQLGLARPVGRYGQLRLDVLVTCRPFAQHHLRHGPQRRHGARFDRFEHRVLFAGLRGEDVGGRDDRFRGALDRRAVESRRHDDQLDAPPQLRFDARAPDDVGVVHRAVGGLYAGVRLDVFQDLHHLVQRQRIGVGGRDVQQDVFRARYERMVEQRRFERRAGHLCGAVLAFGRSHRHVGAAAVAHHLRHVGEVDVDHVAFDGDDLGDALGS